MLGSHQPRPPEEDNDATPTREATEAPNDEHDFPNPGPGIKNTTGSMCYLICVIQALFHTPSFAKWLENTKHTEEDHTGGCLICILQKTTARAQQKNDTMGIPEMIEVFENISSTLDLH